MHEIPDIFWGYPVRPDIFGGYRADAGAFRVLGKNQSTTSPSPWAPVAVTESEKFTGQTPK